MKITIKKEVFKSFHPQFKMAFILAQGVDNKKLEESRHLLEEIALLSAQLFQKDTVKAHHFISPWAAAQEEFGPQAKHYRTALEKLLHQAIRKEKISSGLAVINLVNYLSLKHLVPAGVDDYDKIDGGLSFQLSTGKERISVLKQLKKNALYCRDNQGIVGIKLDFWKSPKTKPNRNTRNFLIHFAALPPFDSKKMQGLLQEAKVLLKDFCGAKLKVEVLTGNKASVGI